MFRKLDPNKSGVVNLNNMKKFYCTKKHAKVVSGNTDYCFSLYMLYALYYDINLPLHSCVHIRCSFICTTALSKRAKVGASRCLVAGLTRKQQSSPMILLTSSLEGNLFLKTSL